MSFFLLEDCLFPYFWVFFVAWLTIYAYLIYDHFRWKRLKDPSSI